MTTICGVDEAGRGPVIGPMVMCGVIIEEGQEETLTTLGVKDSKKLSPKKRELIYEKLKDTVKHKLVILGPKAIDKALNAPSLNLNWLEAIHTATILNELQPDKAIVDSPSNNKDAYKTYLANLLTVKIELQMEHDAERFAPVAAASILAKVTRDRIIEELKKKYGDFGSGYPSDPKTQEFLKNNHDKCVEIFRTTWKSYQRVNQKSLTDF
jgi:ribonuclease HII